MRFPKLRSSSAGVVLAGALGLLCATSAAGAATLTDDPDGRRGAQALPSPLQVVADVVLIESRCRGLTVDYGKLFAYAAQNGIEPVDIMPTGVRRASFDAAYQRRSRDDSDDVLCGDLAARRSETIPGVFMSR